MDYEDQLHIHNLSFYNFIHLHISYLPDIRPAETVKQMSDYKNEQNCWCIIYEELSALSNIEGREEDEERELWAKLGNSESVYKYIDEEREIVDRFINKYPLMFLVLLRASHTAVPLLSSTRDYFLVDRSYLVNEISL